MQKEILIIDGDTGAALEKALAESGYGCARVASAQEVLGAAQSGRFGLAVLNAELPGARAPELISMLRARERLPVLVISPAGSRDGLVEMLNAGAEDYLTRPFELRELIERIEIQLRRFGELQSSGALSHKALMLTPDSFTVTLCGQPVRLTKQEFKILELMLMSPPGRVFSKQDFFDYAWEHGYMGIDKTINVHICNIRRKFREVTPEPYIETIWGLGFRLV